MKTLKALYQSRKAWTGALGVIVATLMAILGPKIGLAEEQANGLAVAIVTLAVAMIGAIAYEDSGAKKTAAAKVLLPLLFVPLLLAGGCAADQRIQAGGALETQVMARVQANDARILDAVLTAYQSARQADIEFTEARTLDAIIAARAKDGALPVDDVRETLLVLRAKRDAAEGQTAAFVAKARLAQAANRVEALYGQKLHQATLDYLAAGIDESAIPGMVQELMRLVPVRGVMPPAPPASP